MTETQASLSCSNLRPCWGYTSSEITIKFPGFYPKQTLVSALSYLLMFCKIFSHTISIFEPILICERGENHSVVFDSLQPCRLQPTKFLSIGFSRQEYWSGLSFPSPGDLPDPRDRTQVPCIAGRCFNLWATRETQHKALIINRDYSCTQGQGSSWQADAISPERAVTVDAWHMPHTVQGNSRWNSAPRRKTNTQSDGAGWRAQKHTHTPTADASATGAKNTHGERAVSATNDARKLKLNPEDSELGSYRTPQMHDNSVN